MTTIISSTPIIQISNAYGGQDIIAKFEVPNFIKLDGNGKDLIVGGMESDTIYGAGGNDTIMGNSGDDNLFGEAGNDIIKGGSGDDTITGGAGADIMSGGTGDDVFVIGSSDLDGSLDTITDFSLDGDVIRFEGIGSNAQVKYDATTGIVSINGKDVLKLDENLAIGNDDIKNTNGGDWEIF
jgi:Ca2+-binding RTX toxin-like protein